VRTRTSAEFNYVPGGSGYLQVSSSAAAMQTLANNGLPIAKSGYLFVYLSNASNYTNMFFDNLVVQHYTGCLIEENAYYPFGLKMSGISSRAMGRQPNKEKTFQGQRFDDELGLDWVQFKWRNHDPQIGRFIEIDPLAEEYVYNSTYAFSENKVTGHVELEGLEAVSAGSAQGWLGAAFGQITEAFGKAIDNVSSFFTKSETEISKPSTVTSASTVFTTATTTDYSTNVFGWIQNSKRPDATVSNGPSLFTVKTKIENKIELKLEVKTNNVKTSTKTALNGSSVEVKVEMKVTVRKIPGKVEVSSSKNYQTGENKTKVKAGVGTDTNQAFGQVEVSNQNGKTKTSVSVGVEEKTGNVKKTLSIGKSFN
jgi:RHS repeat-associated protein